MPEVTGKCEATPHLFFQMTVARYTDQLLWQAPPARAVPHPPGSFTTLWRLSQRLATENQALLRERELEPAPLPEYLRIYPFASLGLSTIAQHETAPIARICAMMSHHFGCDFTPVGPARTPRQEGCGWLIKSTQDGTEESLTQP